MGVCSYCKKYRDEHEECFGWNEAKTFCGVERHAPGVPEHVDAVPSPVSIETPEFSGLPLQKLEGLIERGWQVNGHSIQKDDAIGLVTADGFVGWFTTARQNATTAEARALSLEEEVKRLRKVVSACAAALPNGAYIHPELASIEFMEKLPGEIASVCAALKEHGNG